MLESCHVTTRDDSPKELKASIPIPHTDWERYIAQLAVGIVNEQSPKCLIATREKLYELLINCVPAQVILKTLVLELLPTLDDSIKGQVVQWAAFYEHRIALGSKEIFHLEAFIAKFMAICESSYSSPCVSIETLFFGPLNNHHRRYEYLTGIGPVRTCADSCACQSHTTDKKYLNDLFG